MTVPRHPQLTVKVAPLSELFSGLVRFKLPWFQRAYAWQVPHVGRLLTNLFEDFQAPPDEQYYMLGNIMLAPSDITREAVIIDGHQRIVTMTILFAVLRDLETDPERRATLHARISSEPEGSDKMSKSYHLQPQPMLKEFFHTLIQKPGATALEPDETPSILTETERNIIENRDYLRSELSSEGVSQEVRRDLANFLEKACHVVVRIADTEDNAWQMLRVEEETRLDFHKADRAKATLVGVMPQHQRERAALVWDECQNVLGSQDTYNLLENVRCMKARKRSSAPLESDICRLFSLDKDGEVFMDTIFKPRAQTMAAIRTGTLSAGNKTQSGTTQVIARSTQLMNWVNRDIWMPAALQWIETRGVDAPQTKEFFLSLERLVWIQRLAGIDSPRQERRINRLLSQIDSRSPPEDMNTLMIESTLRRQALNSLKRVNFRRKHITSALLRRVSVEMGDSLSIFNTQQEPTVEHVLPLSPSEKSHWCRTFKTAKIRKNYVNRLGNLTFLTPSENQLAGNQEWSIKREICEGSKFSISKAAAQNEEWNQQIIEKRTDHMIALLFKAWDLPT